MKKNLLKKLVSFTLVSALLSSNAISVLATDIVGETDVELGVINLLAPTAADLKTYVNPFELSDEGSQIRSGNWTFVNQSNVDVKLGVSIKVTSAAVGVEIFTDKTKINDYDGNGVESVVAKQIFIEAAPAKVITVGATPFTALKANPTAAELVYETAGATIAKDDATSAADINFYLEKADILEENNGTFATGDTTAGESGFAVMRLKGVVNPYCTTYAANDFKITATYKANGIKGTAYGVYDELATRNAAGLNVKSLTSAVTVAAPTVTPSIATVSKNESDNVVFTYTLGSGASAGDTVSSVNVSGISGDMIAWGTTFVTTDTSAKTVTFLNAAIKGSAFTTGTKTVTINFANGKTATCTLEVTA